MADRGRVDLARMRAAYEREREDLARSAAAGRVRVIRVQAGIDRNTARSAAVMLEVRSPLWPSRSAGWWPTPRAAASSQSLQAQVPVRLVARVNGDDLEP